MAHHEDNHCALVACCKGHLKQVFPTPSTADREPCPHLVLCKNCGKPHAASFGNTVSTISGLWNDMQRWMISDLVHILLLGKPVPAAKPWLLGVVVEMVGRCKPIRGDLDLFSVQDYPCRYIPCPVACNIIKLGVCSYMSNSLFAPILSTVSIFPAIILCTFSHVKFPFSYCTSVVHQTVLNTPGYKLLI